MTTDWSEGDVVSDAGGEVSCVSGSTAIDALRLAVGSTLGAFVALAIVVAFVLVAKCQHHRRLRRIRRRRRRRRRNSDKSQPLTDSDHLSFFDYYDDDEYDSTYNGDAATTYFSPRLIVTGEYVITDLHGRVVGRECSVDDVNGVQLYDVVAADTDKPPTETATRSTHRHQITAETYTRSALDCSSVACPTVFVDDDDEQRGSAVGRGSGPTPISLPATHCFSRDDDDDDDAFQPTVRPRPPLSEALRPPMTQAQSTAAAGIVVDVMSAADCCETTELLSASDVERTRRTLTPNRYSSIW